jgi:transcriptional regulator with XRE-family HTH domain
MRGKTTSSARSRFIGAELRRHREAANWSAIALCRRLGWLPATMSRVESGQRGATPVNLAIYLTACGVPISQQDQLLALARQGEVWLYAHDDLVPEQVPALRFTRESADRVTCYHPGWLPELLWTKEFATWRGRSPLEAQRSPDGTPILFYLTESSLRSLPTEHHIRGELLTRLVTLSGRDRVRVRVVPAAAEQRVPAAGRFWLFEFGEHRPAACTQSDAMTLFSERYRDIAVYRQIVAELKAVALAEPESLDLITQISAPGFPHHNGQVIQTVDPTGVERSNAV